MKPERSPHKTQLVNSRAKFAVWFLCKGITGIRSIKYKSYDNNKVIFADIRILKRKFAETRVLKKYKRFYVEKNHCYTEVSFKKSHTNLKRKDAKIILLY